MNSAPWIIYCDGSAVPNPGRMGLGAVVTAPDGSRHPISITAEGRGCNNEAELRALMAAMQYAGLTTGIASWWGRGSKTDLRLETLLSAAQDTHFRWAIYYEPESTGDPSSTQIASDLTYIRDSYASSRGYLRVNGRFVVFVYAAGPDACGMADRWAQGNTVNAYVVLKVFSGYKSCASQPDGWHQYGPASATDSQAGYSYTISPGFWKVGEQPRLVRDLAAWSSDVASMVASNAPFQLITTFNEWG